MSLSTKIQLPQKLSPSIVYPLTLESIATQKRISPELGYRLVHIETGRRVPGAFTESEALSIPQVTLHWDWQVDKNNRPACAGKLLHFLEQVCNPSSVIEEIGHDD